MEFVLDVTLYDAHVPSLGSSLIFILRSYESRSAASNALSQIFTLVPLWHPFQDGSICTAVSLAPYPSPEFPMLSVAELVQKGTLLLASSGKEFIKPNGILSSSNEVKEGTQGGHGSSRALIF